MTLVSKQCIRWARDYFLPRRNGTEAGILNLARSVIFILLHGGEKFECEHEHVVRAISVTHNIAGISPSLKSAFLTGRGAIISSIPNPTHSLTK